MKKIKKILLLLFLVIPVVITGVICKNNLELNIIEIILLMLVGSVASLSLCSILEYMEKMYKCEKLLNILTKRLKEIGLINNGPYDLLTKKKQINKYISNLLDLRNE